MNMNEILVESLQQAIVERTKANASIYRLLERIAEIKRCQLSDVLIEKQAFVSEGFVLVETSYEVSDWKLSAFDLKARFLLKDVETPKDLTSKERQLINEYKCLIKDVDWNNRLSISRYWDKAEEIDRSLKWLKHRIRVVKELYWSFEYETILEGEPFFRRGYTWKD